MTNHAPGDGGMVSRADRHNRMVGMVRLALSGIRDLDRAGRRPMDRPHWQLHANNLREALAETKRVQRELDDALLHAEGMLIDHDDGGGTGAAGTDPE